MDYRRLIPNMCTSSNLVFGMCSILSTYSGNLVWGSIFILLALVADGLDGRTARFFGVASEMGKEMDSLCDLGSFGIAPAFLAWAFVLHNHGFLGVVVAIFFAICGMWRLARFNVNASVVHGYFMGLAIPAGGNIVAMTTLLFVELGVDPMAFGIAYPIVMAFVGWLMVSHVHYPNFKGDGAEPIYLISKIVALVLFLAILWLGHASLLAALAVALFSTYAVLGIVNSLLASFAKKG
ncbi:CDP-diacylglycerol--serine O-phosphatidyltransferase [Mitsuokella jalaludinii]|uniref:CDP-diacylglycerol--serine O-phosphatidyltransferase n=2 Tax=Mitsuokella jalaludinii TaxID=187979 RepID=A0A174BYI9_9FIRM|nr:CDP-diacylglycerol--serine O-phosphatidyltransferase [Mitsuokella jalaludinii]MCI6606889.1 CDP-diacylglycerol--serine O-phosphatidyltransferase [Mitsuokella jalaludinii]MCI6612402.1 CDP-diacylglycerol--serine O-phosphatidyltransferase [Mitsuokella jalaludinii]MCI7186439.1 CDP-diacylglycerol--serine O-phosphatidyltransferase [Mitsuokella jalaludinii]MCI7717247.1 CDP-diacylglycerol--serine O-phosphatidyltransferase [Mitsuokella jalaludinii]MDY5365001.1 CDP-diacylglycerol--serine O-phosphatidy